MKVSLGICFIFAIGSHAKPNSAPSIPSIWALFSNPSKSSSFFDVDAELDKLPCFSIQDLENLWNGNLRHILAHDLGSGLAKKAAWLIGKEELCKSLGLPPPGPWKDYKDAYPSEEELENAKTIEEYYLLREPKAYMLSLSSRHYFEHNFPPAIAVLDSKFPSIRNAYRGRFEEMVRQCRGGIGKKDIDSMLKEFGKLYMKVDMAIGRKMVEYPCNTLSAAVLK